MNKRKEDFNMNPQPNLKSPFVRLNDEEYEEEMRKRNDPTERKGYIIMIYAPEEEDVHFRWIPCIGRTEAYERMKTLVQEYAVDLRKSRVLVDGTTFENSSSLYEVIKHFSHRIFKDGFEVDEYDSYPDGSEEYGNKDPMGFMNSNPSIQGEDQSQLLYPNEDDEEYNV